MSRPPSFARRTATAAFISLLMLALFLLIGYAANFFFLVFGGIAFAVGISALAHFVSHKTPLPYSWSVGLVLVGLAGVRFAPPLVAMLLVIVEKLYVQDRLEVKAQPSGPVQALIEPWPNAG